MNKDLIKEAEALIAEVDRTHRYSMSKIYGLYNRVFKTNEVPQSCASCLIRKVRELKEWIESEKSKDPEPDKIIPTSGETDGIIKAKTNKSEGRYNKYNKKEK